MGGSGRPVDATPAPDDSRHTRTTKEQLQAVSEALDY
jgi:hypothetical protein